MREIAFAENGVTIVRKIKKNKVKLNFIIKFVKSLAG